MCRIRTWRWEDCLLWARVKIGKRPFTSQLLRDVIITSESYATFFCSVFLEYQQSERHGATTIMVCDLWDFRILKRRHNEWLSLFIAPNWMGMYASYICTGLMMVWRKFELKRIEFIKTRYHIYYPLGPTVSWINVAKPFRIFSRWCAQALCVSMGSASSFFLSIELKQKSVNFIWFHSMSAALFVTYRKLGFNSDKPSFPLEEKLPNQDHCQKQSLVLIEWCEWVTAL